MILEIIFVVLNLVLAGLLAWEGREAQKLVKSRDAIISTMLEMQTVINSNASLQEKSVDSINRLAQEIDMVEKVIAIHAQALKLYGPALLRLQPQDLEHP